MVSLSSIVGDITSQSACVQAVLGLYQQFHQFPELSLHEHRTAQTISDILTDWGVLPIRCGGTGVVAMISSGDSGGEPVVAFRADIDGLPILETTGVDYQSQNTGLLTVGGITQEVPVMHACGHDAHIASALGIMYFLLHHKELWQGTAEFIFQPAEEVGCGARNMVDNGLWDILPRPEILYGQHIAPLPVHTIALNEGFLLARTDYLRVTVYGKGAHSSIPQAGVDAIVLAAHMITRLQTIVSREVSPLDNAVLSICTIHGGMKDNIVCDKVEFTINVRTYGTVWEDTIYPAICRILHAEAQASGAPEPDIVQVETYLPVENDGNSTRMFIAEANKVFGVDKVFSQNAKVMGSEDFSVLAESIDLPYVFWFYGGYTPEFFAQRVAAGLNIPGNHQSDFMPDNPAEAIATGIKAGVTAMLSRLKVDAITT